GDVVAFHVDGVAGAQLRVVVADFGGVDGRVDRADLGEARRGVRVDQPGVDVQAAALNDARPRGDAHVSPHGGDLAVLDQHGAVLDYRAADGEDAGIPDGVEVGGGGLRRGVRGERGDGDWKIGRLGDWETGCGAGSSRL